MATADHHDRITIGRGFRRQIGTDGAARTAAVINHEGRAAALGNFLKHHARNDVGAAPGWKRHDHTHRTLGIFRSRRGDHR